jgi:hypothetical protein
MVIAAWLSSISITGPIRTRSSVSSLPIQTAPQVARHSAMYSASGSDVESATTVCYLLDQCIWLQAIKFRMPAVPVATPICIGVSNQWSFLWFLIFQRFAVPFRYRKILFTAVKCASLGYELNFDTAPTAWAMSGQVRPLQRRGDSQPSTDTLQDWHLSWIRHPLQVWH